MDRAFRGVWIPADIWVNEDLNVMEKAFLVEIDSLDGVYGCYAGNSHFKTFSGLSKNRCSTIINNLKDKGYVTIEITYKADKKTVEKRVIKVCQSRRIPKYIPDNSVEIEVDCDRENRGINVGEIDVENEASLDIDANCETDIKQCGNKGGEAEGAELQTIFSDELGNMAYKEAVISEGNKSEDLGGQPIYKLVIEYLNKASSSRFNYKSSKNQKIINARVREGYCFEDFKNVIDMKCDQWWGSDMSKYLRPDTLFSGNFDKYINEFHSKKVEGKEGQAYGNKYKYPNNYKNSKSDYNDELSMRLLAGCSKESTILSDEEKAWAAKELW
ncbi:MAG: conserved phage C-terminal domain-containing protein [Clostridium sp.]